MIIETIKGRRAVFPAQFGEATISKEEILTILEAANWAPTHRRTEPWRFKVFHGESQRKLSEFMGAKYKETADPFSEFKYKKNIEKPLQSGCVIAICMQRDPLASIPQWEEIAATAMAVQNMWLTAHEIGIGAFWSSPKTVEYLGELIPFSEGERCIGLFYMGKYDGKLPEGHRKTSISEKTVWI